MMKRPAKIIGAARDVLRGVKLSSAPTKNSTDAKV